jgi:adhesin/invasin
MRKILFTIIILFLSTPAFAQGPQPVTIQFVNSAPSTCALNRLYIVRSTGAQYMSILGACTLVGSGTSSISGSGTTNTVAKWSSSTALGNSSITDSGTSISTTEPTGIGSTVTPPTMFTVFDTASTSPRGLMSWQANTGTDGARLGFRKNRGTFASPTTIVTGDTIGRLVAWPYDGAAWLEMGSIAFESTGTIATNRTPTQIVFKTATDAAPSVLTTALTIGADQKTTFAQPIILNGATSGTSTVTAPAIAGTSTITLPNASSTLPVFSQQITFAGPTTARTVTLPDSSFTAVATTQLGSPQGWEDTGAVRTVGAASTQYNCLFGCISVTFNSTESNRTNIVPIAGTLTNAYIRTGGTQPNDGALTCTFRNTTTTTDSSVVVTVTANASAGTFTDLTHTMTVAAGDSVVMKCVNASSSASAGLVESRFLFTRTN